MLGETYVEELRLADTELLLRASGGSDCKNALNHGANNSTIEVGDNPDSAKATTDPVGGKATENCPASDANRSLDGMVLDARTMGISTAACLPEASSEVAGDENDVSRRQASCTRDGGDAFRVHRAVLKYRPIARR